MHKPERSNYPFTSITESFKRVVNMNHKENDSLLYNSKCLKQAKEILEAHVGR